MNIFFTGSIRGGRSLQPQYAAISEALSMYGTVLSLQIGEEALSEYGETHLSSTEIFEREHVALSTATVVVAEVTTPSLGVGYLICAATKQGKKVLALYRGDDTLKLSGIIKGDPGVTVHTYKTLTDIQDILKKHFAS